MTALALTTLARCRAWLNSQGTTNPDSRLAPLIPFASRAVMNWLNRDDVRVRDVTEIVDGPAGDRLVIRDWPVLSVASISFGTGTITTEATGFPRTSGFLLSTPPIGGGNQYLTLFGYKFTPGRSNVSITYRAGWLAEGETHGISVADTYQVATDLFWLADVGVTIDGVPAVAVTGTPTAGQYSVTAGVYQFAAADAGKTAALSYSYSPEDLVQVVTELVGERYRAADRIGMTSQTAGAGISTAFSQRDINAAMRSLLSSYRLIL